MYTDSMGKNICLILLVLLLSVCFLVSCSNNDAESHDFSTIEKSVSEIPLDGFYEMEITPGNIISLSDYTEETGLLISSSSSSKSRSDESSRGNENIVFNQNGFGMPVPHSNGKTDFSGDVFSLSGHSVIKLERFSFDDDLVISQAEMSNPLMKGGRAKHKNDRGEILTEEYYRIHLKNGKYDGFDAPEVAILQTIYGDIVDYSNPEYGFVENGRIGLSSSGNTIYGLVDLTEKNAITVFNTIEYKGGSQMAAKIVLAKPEELVVGQSRNITSSVNEYKITDEGKSGNYYIRITTTDDTDLYNEKYQVVVRANSRPRYAYGEHAGNRKPMTLIPISRTGSDIYLWVGEIDDTFIFDCCINTQSETGDFGTIQLCSASGTIYEDWGDTHVIELGTTQIDLPQYGSDSYYIKGLYGDCTFTYSSTYVEDEQTKVGGIFVNTLYSSTYNVRDVGTMGMNNGGSFSGQFNDGYAVINLWNPHTGNSTTSVDSKVTITIENKVHTDVEFDTSIGQFRCFDDDCGKTFNANDAGNLCLGKWEFKLGGKTAVANITGWGSVPITITDGADVSILTATAGFDTTTYKIYLDIPQYGKKYLSKIFVGKELILEDGTIMTKV